MHYSRKKQPVPDEIEMYNLTYDPLETENLANPIYSTTKSKVIQQKLQLILQEQRERKRLVPENDNS